LSESNIILQDCYNGHLAHFQYTSLSRLRKKFFHSTLIDTLSKQRDQPPRIHEPGELKSGQTGQRVPLIGGNFDFWCSGWDSKDLGSRPEQGQEGTSRPGQRYGIWSGAGKVTSEVHLASRLKFCFFKLFATSSLQPNNVQSCRDHPFMTSNRKGRGQGQVDECGSAGVL